MSLIYEIFERETLLLTNKGEIVNSHFELHTQHTLMNAKRKTISGMTSKKKFNLTRMKRVHLLEYVIEIAIELRDAVMLILNYSDQS